ncbi:MAG: hypothetical protein ACKVPX_08260 [Myxococcaceae bacterium]
MKQLFFCVALVGGFVVLNGCVPGANENLGISNVEGLVAGFWRGLWHGIVVPVTFLVSLFTKDVQVYEVHNNGGWYNFGFLLGVTLFHGGGHAARPRMMGRR